MPQFWGFLAIFGVFHTVWIKLEIFFKKEFATQQVCLLEKKIINAYKEKEEVRKKETGTEREIQYLSILDKLCLEIIVI